MPTPNSQCPVHGCGVWSNRWGKKSYPLPSADIFTLQLASTIDLSINNRICQPCWERHRHHTMKLDGRMRVVVLVPIASPSPLDALLSAAISPLPSALVSLPSPLSLSSLPSPSLTPARVLASFQPPTTVLPNCVHLRHLPSAAQPPSTHQRLAGESPVRRGGRGSRLKRQQRRRHRLRSRRERLSSCTVAWTRGECAIQLHVVARRPQSRSKHLSVVNQLTHYVCSRFQSGPRWAWHLASDLCDAPRCRR